MRKVHTIIIGLYLSLGSGSAVADVVVVVSAQSEVRQLQRIEVENIFLGKVHRFSGGADATPLDLEEGAIARDEFYLKLNGRTAAQVKAHWAKLIFTGRGHPPETASNLQELISKLIENPYAIGYMDESTVDSRLKIVLRL